MSTEPDAATQELKLTLEKVRQTAELNPDVRDQLVDVLQSALRQAAKRKIEVDAAHQQQLENAAAAQERLVVTENLLRNQQKVQQLMQRFNSLMNEGRYVLAEEAAAVEAKKLVPDSPVPRLAELEARQVGYYVDFMKLRDQRWKGVVDVLYQVERAHIPFSDNPPIVYPDAETWQALTARRKEKWSSVDLANPKPAERKIREELKKPTQMEFIEMPLSDVIDYLKDYHGIEIQLDKKALDDVGIGSDTPITKNLKGISLRSALRLLLKEHSLTYVIENEMLLITTPEEADNRLVTKVYPVADLVIPVTSNMMGGMGGGMMGGMGGGMMGGMGGGMMGGMGGGMMGGMGGGMGGGMMGGMGGGMGMFNLPRDLLPKVPPGGFQAFAVQDNLEATPKAAAPVAAKSALPAAAEAPATIDNRPAKIQIDMKEGAKPETVWNEYFAKNQPQPAAVRDAVRRLMNERKFDQVIALINAALRQHQAQPWMYEALALALDAAGRPKEDVERAVMSAVDFVDNTADLMYIGAYLAQIGLNQRALQVYRQAAAIDPVRPEPYMLGLRAARALDDLNGLKWASLGILGQAWPKEQAHVWQAGVGVANEVLARLKSENRTKEADAFKAALDEAVQRDCAVIVKWTGDADFDLLVEEPSGTVCSLRSPRTTAGGIMVGDLVSQAGGDSFGGHSEAYVCPKGFDGSYQVLVRRVWGNATAGRVNVTVGTHYLGSNAFEMSKWIPLEKDQVLVTFDLKDGRRKEPLRDQQVANAAIGQLAMNRQILAQQIAAAIDPGTLQSLAVSRSMDASVNGGVGRFPFAIGGAVGYQPVITVLPEGAMLEAQAVISADRRYVRITPMPFFSGVSQVNTFNMATGASGTTSGGTGNQGYSGSSFGSSGTSGIGSSGF